MNSKKKNNILKKIRLALTESTPIPFSDVETDNNIYQPAPSDMVIEFAEKFTELQGKFCYCLNREELFTELNKLVSEKNWRKVYSQKEFITENFDRNIITADLDNCDVSITTCEKLIARTGTIVFGSNISRISSVYAPVHICIATSSQLVYDHIEAIEEFKNKYPQQFPSSLSFATGPSRTADIEKTLVVGVHGPKEVYCFLVDDIQQAS